MSPDVRSLSPRQTRGMPNQPALRRDRSAARLGGVCAALAHAWGVDPKLVRIAVVVLTLFTGGLAISGYLTLWLLIPQVGSDTIPLRRWLPFARNWSDTKLLITAAVTTILIAGMLTGIAPGGIVLVMVVWLIVMFGAHRPNRHVPPVGSLANRTPPRTEYERLARAWENRVEAVYTGSVAPFAFPDLPEQPHPGAITAPTSRRVWFGILAGFGAIWIALSIVEQGGTHVPPLAYASGFLAVLGVALLASVRRNRRPFGLATLTVLVGLVTGLMLTGDRVLDEVVPAPATVTFATMQDLPETTQLGIGSTMIDLRDTQITANRTATFNAEMGQVTVKLPRTGNVVVNSTVNMGQIVDGQKDLSGMDQSASSKRITNPEDPVLTINVALEVGQIEVLP